MALYQLSAMKVWLPLSSPCMCVLDFVRRVYFMRCFDLWGLESDVLGCSTPTSLPLLVMTRLALLFIILA